MVYGILGSLGLQLLVLLLKKSELVTVSSAVILVETLNGLDAWWEGRYDFLRGSPVMLFMWSSEIFRMVVPPEYPLAPVPNFFTRYFITMGLEIESWRIGLWSTRLKVCVDQCLGRESYSPF